jgi:hypothetical protein
MAIAARARKAMRLSACGRLFHSPRSCDGCYGPGLIGPVFSGVPELPLGGRMNRAINSARELTPNAS